MKKKNLNSSQHRCQSCIWKTIGDKYFCHTARRLPIVWRNNSSSPNYRRQSKTEASRQKKSCEKPN
ncbi:hypothetical protein J1C08_001376 [Escherichia fergusonii]|nr:hypothetical protein [Escherichia fergusonii]